MSAHSLSDLQQFTGDDVRYAHLLNRRVIYTPGVRHVAEAGQAYWLIDAIASHIGAPPMRRAIARDERIDWMHFWTLKVRSDRSAALTARADKGERPFVRQSIVYTDFPLDRIDIWAAFDGAHWTLYLPSEH
jgi:hypothetical protein